MTKKINLFNEQMLKKIRSANKAEIVQSVRVGKTDQENELVFFIKPEIFDVDNPSDILNSFQLISDKLEEFKVEISGAAIVPGAILEEYEIMNRHYGFINQLSRKASEIIDPDTLQQIQKHLKIKNIENHRILGGHEFLEAFDTDIETLSDTWFGKGANKLRSGFYFVEDTFEGEPVILINGFHPAQLQHFTREDHRIYLLLLHTNSDWEALKFDMVGDTFPEKAKPGSIRGMLYANPDHYGQKEVSINTNGVHLSAGPFEAAFEVVNFFGPLIDLDPATTPPLAIYEAQHQGLSKEQALDLLENPVVNDSDLFSETENLNTCTAVNRAVEWLGQ